MGLPEAPWPPIVEGEEEEEHGASETALCSSGEVFSTIYKVTEAVPESFAAGVCGLRNLGNTCFMNAGLQCLLSNAQLLEFLLSFPTDRSSEPPCGASLLVSQLARLAQQVWSGRFGTLRPTTFKDALAGACPQFGDYRQHDCQEFLTLLLDALHEETNEANFINGFVAPAAGRGTLRRREARLPSGSLESKYSEARESTVLGEEAPESPRSPAAESLPMEGGFPVHGDLLAAAIKEALEENLEPEAKRLKPDSESGLSAEESWEKYRASNRSVVVDTFQGQLQSKVVCAECGHVSVTYEPFMYLPLPLPHATEMHVGVTYVPPRGPRLRCTVKLGRVGRAGQLCGALEDLLGDKGQHPHGIVLANVSPEDSVIERFLEDHLPVRLLHDGGRPVYAFALGPPTTDHAPPGESGRKSWQTCAICLEEKADDELRTHPPCGGLLCYACVQVSCEHYGRGSLLCPVCNASLASSGREFVPLSANDPWTRDRPVTVSVLLHGDHGNMSWRDPALLCLPKCITEAIVRSAAASLVSPDVVIVSVSILNARGRRCGRCPVSGDCKGCPLEAGQRHTLQPSDCVGVRCLGEPPAIQLHPSLEEAEFPKTLTLVDCLEAFCESETLDEENHWLCPMCRRHRRARKTLSLWRLPKTLMVYLKRFVFQEFSGSKLEAPVEFPLRGLDLSPFLRGPHGSREGSSTYDLHAFVCHFGDVNSGHYTAYARHGVSGQWFHYDDEATGLRTPTGGDRQHAYVLFYQLRNDHDAGKSHPVSGGLENTAGPLEDPSDPDAFRGLLCRLEDCAATPSAL